MIFVQQLRMISAFTLRLLLRLLLLFLSSQSVFFSLIVDRILRCRRPRDNLHRHRKCPRETIFIRYLNIIYLIQIMIQQFVGKLKRPLADPETLGTGRRFTRQKTLTNRPYGTVVRHGVQFV